MSSIVKMILRRLLTLVPLMLGIALFVFVIMRLSPVNSAVAALGDQASPEQIAEYEASRGLDQPAPVQFVRFLGNVVQGDFGETIGISKPVAGLIAEALPLTMQLTLLGVGLALVIALALGITAALFRDRWPDQVIRVLSMTGISVPSFWLALLMIQHLSLGLGWFPNAGYTNPAESLTGWLRSMAMPAMALAVPVGASLARIVRTSMVEELDKEYVRTAYGAGLPPSIVVGRNVLRNALVNPLTVLGLRVGYLLGGTIIIEAIFTMPGMGTLVMQAVGTNDTNLAQGTILVIAFTFVVVNLLVDILYLFANPRLRGGH
ncbi:ABC transporter permease [Intrasporangium calvum]|uniref:Binding-protein-dependent transport systems inner membrane component n=1 Tax=Intrasporangium calvum (strain ATCC 23552 / DSM 43043 / JCM 3097 / NBRC 12989 / NCIMB 10167 / NRRL B-3866 / 7 KIP) TaxID=710696 RepID=E6SCR7_INTC7|nr:ABC transporter permease [Intrasporangium calvum]ADU47472.1 binding-protein-dependent transport systems inner membrane component [Intrasporangium calvum DSM 43043]AXG12681.1 ABC transporter permease [Intrasporangium calvum]